MTPELLKYLPQTRKGGSTSNSLCQANIKLMLMPEKDSTERNYRPISSMNTGAEIVNNVIGNSMQQHTERIMHHNQVGFIPWTQGWFCICKSINVKH
jgi:hypothetical protein